MANLDSNSKSTPLIKSRQTISKPIGSKDLPETNPMGGVKSPTRLDNEVVKSSYDDRRETTLTGASTLYKGEHPPGELIP